MRAALVYTAFVSIFVSSASAAPRFRIPATPLAAKPGDLHAFAGQVKAVDPTARTVTLGMPMRFTFKVPAATEIKIRKGGAATFDAIRPGVGVQIVAVRGVNTWTAQKIEIDRARIFPEEVSVRTVQGKTITGPQAAEFVAYEPPAEVVNRNINFGERHGYFLLTIRPDGTVAKVQPIKSTGVKELDERSIQRLMRIKFRPGSVSEARVPASFSTFRRY